MAGIDKIYIYSKEDWVKCYDYCKCNERKIKKDTEYNVMDYIYYTLSDLDDIKTWDDGIVFSNFPEGIDRWLIRNCNIDTINERLKVQYHSSFEEIKYSVDDSYEYDKSTHFKVLYQKKGRRLKKNPNKSYFLVDIITIDKDNNWWYNEANNKWVNTIKEYKPCTSSTCVLNAKSLKSVFRQIRKWHLPKNLQIKVCMGWYSYNIYIITK